MLGHKVIAAFVRTMRRFPGGAWSTGQRLLLGMRIVSTLSPVPSTKCTLGDAPDPEASDGGGSSDEDGGGLEGAGGASMVTSLNLDDISSSEDDAFDDNDQDDDDDDDNHDDDGDIATDSDTVAMARREGGISAAAGRDEGGEEGGHGQLQANVFAGMRDEDVDATVEAQIMRLDRQDTKAKRGRGAGMAGEGELKRAREALR